MHGTPMHLHHPVPREATGGLTGVNRCQGLTEILDQTTCLMTMAMDLIHHLRVSPTKDRGECQVELSLHQACVWFQTAPSSLLRQHRRLTHHMWRKHERKDGPRQRLSLHRLIFLDTSSDESPILWVDSNPSTSSEDASLTGQRIARMGLNLGYGTQ